VEARFTLSRLDVSGGGGGRFSAARRDQIVADGLAHRAMNIRGHPLVSLIGRSAPCSAMPTAGGLRRRLPGSSAIRFRRARWRCGEDPPCQWVVGSPAAVAAIMCRSVGRNGGNTRAISGSRSRPGRLPLRLRREDHRQVHLRDLPPAALGTGTLTIHADERDQRSPLPQTCTVATHAHAELGMSCPGGRIRARDHRYHRRAHLRRADIVWCSTSGWRPRFGPLVDPRVKGKPRSPRPTCSSPPRSRHRR
jgi:hypothetical protein